MICYIYSRLIETVPALRTVQAQRQVAERDLSAGERGITHIDGAEAVADLSLADQHMHSLYATVDHSELFDTGAVPADCCLWGLVQASVHGSSDPIAVGNLAGVGDKSAGTSEDAMASTVQPEVKPVFIVMPPALDRIYTAATGTCFLRVRSMCTAAHDAGKLHACWIRLPFVSTTADTLFVCPQNFTDMAHSSCVMCRNICQKESPF